MSIQLRIKHYNAQGEVKLRGAATLDGSIVNFEKNLKKNKGTWEYAVLYQDGNIVHYYHHSTGVVPIDRKLYNQQLNQTRINLYIVPTYEYKQRTGQQRFKPIYGAKIEDMASYDNNDVLKIQAYLNNKLIRTYQDGKFY